MLEKQYDTVIGDMGVAHQKFMREQASQMESFRDDLNRQFVDMKDRVEGQQSEERALRDAQYSQLENLVVTKQNALLQEVGALREKVDVLENDKLPAMEERLREFTDKTVGGAEDRVMKTCDDLNTALSKEAAESSSNIKQLDERQTDLETVKLVELESGIKTLLANEYTTQETFALLEERSKGNFEFLQQELVEKSEWLEKLEKQCLQLIDSEANSRRQEAKEQQHYANKRFSTVEENVAELIKNVQTLDGVTKEVLNHSDTLNAARKQLKDVWALADGIKTDFEEFREEQKMVVGFLDTQQKQKFQILQKDVSNLTRLYAMPGVGVGGA